MAGDFNIIPQPEDAANIDNWEKDALFLPESRAEFRKIINLGFTDAFRAKNFGSGNYSFWDYQAGAWDSDDGVRIDHFLLTPQCADLLENCKIDKHIRSEKNRLITSQSGLNSVFNLTYNNKCTGSARVIFICNVVVIDPVKTLYKKMWKELTQETQ